MDFRKPDELVRDFSNAVVTWKISNIYLAFCRPVTHITSPDFSISGPRDTAWRLYLHSSEREENYVDLILELLESRAGSSNSTSSSPTFNLRWFAHLVDPKRDVPVGVEDRELHFIGRRVVVEKYHVDEIMQALPRKKPRELKIRCYMMIDFGHVFHSRTSVPCGLNALSSSLAELIDKPLFPDWRVKVGTKVYDVHKDMLFRRGYGFISLMIKHGSDSGITLPEYYDESSVEAVFRYLYSGKLESILSSPRIAIYNCIENLKIPELKNVYPKEKIKIESKIECNDFYDYWEIENIRLSNESPVFHHLATDSRWQLHIFPAGKPDCMTEGTKFGLLQVLLLRSDNSLDVDFEATIVNENDQTLRVVRKSKRMNTEDKLEIPFFYRGVISEDNSCINKPLSLSFFIRIAREEEMRAVRKIKPSPSYYLTNNQSLVILSKMMGAVLENPDHYDLLLEHEKDYICVHKFLLAARSPNFKLKLLQMGYNEVFTLSNLKRHELQVFLEYLYTGLMNDYSYETAMVMYQLARFYVIPDLKATANVSGKMTSQNVLEILMFADDRRISHLKCEAMQLIGAIGEQIKEDPLWKFFVHKKPELAVDLMDFIRRANEGVDEIENIRNQNIIHEE